MTSSICVYIDLLVITYPHLLWLDVDIDVDIVVDIVVDKDVDANVNVNVDVDVSMYRC